MSEAVAPWLRLLLVLEAGDAEEEDEVGVLCTETGVEEGEASRSPDSILSGSVLNSVTSLLFPVRFSLDTYFA